jgi:hypothetical protein
VSLRACIGELTFFTPLTRHLASEAPPFTPRLTPPTPLPMSKPSLALADKEGAVRLRQPAAVSPDRELAVQFCASQSCNKVDFPELLAPATMVIPSAFN